MDLLMGLFRGGTRKQPIKQAADQNANQHHGLNGPFRLLNGPLSGSMGCFPDFVLRGRFTS